MTSTPKDGFPQDYYNASDSDLLSRDPKGVPAPVFRRSSPDGTTTDIMTGLPTPSEDTNSYYKFSRTSELIDNAEAQSYRSEKQRSVRIVNKSGDLLNSLQTDVAKVQSYASPLQAVMDSEPAQAIKHSIAVLVDGLPALVKVLDEVSKIHPFISVAVSAFRIAIQLDLKRRDNDKKISLLFVEMRDMMSVLAQLQSIDRDKRAGEDKCTVQGRMQGLIDKTVEDITNCANACNTYSKQKIWTKVVKCSSWDSQLQGYAKAFKTRCKEFQLALSLYIGQGVNMVNDKLDDIEDQMKRLLDYFHACMSPEELALQTQLAKLGGPEVVLRDNQKLRALFEYKGASEGLATRPADRRYGAHASAETEFKDLQKELKTDINVAVRDNLKQFEAKFEMQRRELEELRRTMTSETDRVIKSFSSGPHERIEDPDIRKVWGDMRWRGNVKARHFVLALRDHFRDELDHLKRTSGTTPVASTGSLLRESDEWALEYVNVTRLQPIIEAFDDDASGFITIAEVNAFTKARPADWSLLHWLAYWAAGFQMVMSTYCEKIDHILSKMFSLKDHVLPVNRAELAKYLYAIWSPATELTAGFRRIPVDDVLLSKFQTHIEGEEARLRENLERFNYDIDAQDSLDLITGPGRIEKYVFPLLYLILQRHYEVMHLGRMHILDTDELSDAEDTLVWVYSTVNDRYFDLCNLFKQQKLNPDYHFKIFGFEMFQHWHKSEEFWSIERLKKAEYVAYEYDDSVEKQDVDSSILIHPIANIEKLRPSGDFIETEQDLCAEPALRALLGHWSGYAGDAERFPFQAMISMDFHVSTENPKQVTCSGYAPAGVTWTMTGEYEVGEDGKVTYTFQRVYESRFSTQHFRCELVDEETLTGSYGLDRDDMPSQMLFKRTPCELMCFRPLPKELEENKARARWNFACSAIIDEVRRTSFRWSWFYVRWQVARRFIAILLRSDGAVLTPEELQTLSECQRRMTPWEARFYSVEYELRSRMVLKHIDIGCDVCGNQVEGARIICLDCGIRSTIDICDKPECYGGEVTLETRDDLTTPHLPSHNMIKVRTLVHQERELGMLYRNGATTLRRARSLFTPTFEDATEKENTEETTKDPLLCARKGCGKRVVQPCWYCIECEDEVFICAECDAKFGGISSGEHQPTHTLVRCQPLDSGTSPEAERAAALDKRISTLEGNLQELQHRIEQNFLTSDAKVDVVRTGLSGKMELIDDRLQRMEDMLLLLARSVLEPDPAGDSSVRRIPPARQGTWPLEKPGMDKSRSESDFSAWVRQMRSST